METVRSNEAVVVSVAVSAYKSILMELSQLSPGQTNDITRPGSASGYTFILMKRQRYKSSAGRVFYPRLALDIRL